jgi:UDP:flavonoid glycosyltransferase YjiC (YdhE family)
MEKNILVAPLNWGLGHATRCIPIIMALEKNGFRPIIASDGVALALLKKEFPHLVALELPSYSIEYAKKGENFKWKLLKNSPKTLKAMFSEKGLVKKWIKEYNLSGIISDNRLGVHSKKVPSVFITHQLFYLEKQLGFQVNYINFIFENLQNVGFLTEKHLLIYQED